MLDTWDHCNEASKSVVHAFWDCLELLQIWNAFLECRFHLPQGLSTILELLLQAQIEGKNLEKLEMLLWMIWFCQNHIRVNNVDFPAS